jgi:hypothetical protein
VTEGGAEPEAGGPLEAPREEPHEDPPQAPLQVVTVQAGDRYPDLYVNRLRRMVARHLPREHRFICWTDRPEPGRFDADVEMRDLSGWDLSGWFNKLRLFDRAVTGEAPFLFLDLTMVIRGSLAPLLAVVEGPGSAQGEAAEASLVAVPDWNYPIVNSSVMWVRPDARTQEVWDAWVEGRFPREGVAGDQNWINTVFAARERDGLGFWPEGLVASYKGLRKMAARDPAAARAALERAVILKFHGRPKPHEVLEPWRHLPSTVLRHPLRPRLWRYLTGEIKAHWR